MVLAGAEEQANSAAADPLIGEKLALADQLIIEPIDHSKDHSLQPQALTPNLNDLVLVSARSNAVSEKPVLITTSILIGILDATCKGLLIVMTLLC